MYENFQDIVQPYYDENNLTLQYMDDDIHL